MTDTARTILAQLGGSRFLAMTGAKSLLNGGNYLQFDLPRGFATNGATKVRIALDASDTYTVEFFKWSARRFECIAVGKTEGVYAEDLRIIFTRETGLDCTLARN